MRPFKYGCVVDGENFCARPELEGAEGVGAGRTCKGVFLRLHREGRIVAEFGQKGHHQTAGRSDNFPAQRRISFLQSVFQRMASSEDMIQCVIGTKCKKVAFRAKDIHCTERSDYDRIALFRQ